MRRAAALLLVAAACTGGPADAPDPPAAATGATAGAADPAWATLAPAAIERTEVAAATDGARILVIGGVGRAREALADVEVYDPQSDSWTEGPDLPHAVHHAMAAAHEGAIYVFGGYTDTGAPSERAFTLSGDAWQELPPMPEPRAAGGAGSADGVLVVAGGVGPAGLAATTLVFDPGIGVWGLAPPPPTPREHLGVAGDGDRIYLVGGRLGGLDTNVDAAEAFDPDTATWETLAALPTTRGGLAAAATAGGLVVAVGGEASATFEEAEALDTRGRGWLTLPPLPTARHGLGVVALGDTVYALAGGTEPGFTFSGANEAIDLSGA